MVSAILARRHARRCRREGRRRDLSAHAALSRAVTDQVRRDVRSFRSTVPPPANTRFGRVAGPELVAACTNPAALAGGSGALRVSLRDGKLIVGPRHRHGSFPNARRHAMGKCAGALDGAVRHERVRQVPRGDCEGESTDSARRRHHRGSCCGGSSDLPTGACISSMPISPSATWWTSSRSKGARGGDYRRAESRRAWRSGR